MFVPTSPREGDGDVDVDVDEDEDGGGCWVVGMSLERVEEEP